MRHSVQPRWSRMSNLKNLNDRLNFLQINPQVQNRLRGIKSVAMGALPAALDAFYAQMRAVPDVAKFFSGEDMIQHAKAKQHAHWDLIIDGRFDDAYMESVSNAGEVHARIRLEPRWFIDGYAIVLEHLLRAAVAARWPQPRFGKKRGIAEKQLAEEVSALAKATFLDMDMTISVYIEAWERHWTESEVKIKRSAGQVVTAMSDAMHALAAGDLTH